MVLRLKQRIHTATGISVKEQRLLAGNTEHKSTMLLGFALGKDPATPTVITIIRRHAEHAEWTLAAMSHENGLRDLPADARGCRDVVMAALKRWGVDVLQHATAELMADRGFVSAAVTQDGLALRHAEAGPMADRYPGLAQGQCAAVRGDRASSGPGVGPCSCGAAWLHATGRVG